MSDALLLAVLDALLPGHGDVPPASHAGLDGAALRKTLRSLLDRLDAADYLAADVEQRAEMLRAAERSDPAMFRGCLDQVLAVYCQAPAVLAAFGWRGAPPMPQGHGVTGDDAAALALLDQVRARGPLWRR